MSLDQDLLDYTTRYWQEHILDSLASYIEIPNKSPTFDPDWQANGHMHRAVAHVVDWIEQQQIPDLSCEVHELPGRTPTLLLEYPGNTDDTILIYGHLDKQPEFSGWFEGLDPWQPVFRDDRLYGRGGADDGYAVYAAVCAVRTMQKYRLRSPRILVLIECSEESGSPDLPHYMEALADTIGSPSLVIALDSTCGNYDQLWLTTSLRGMLIGELTVKVLDQGVHSGGAGGMVPSSFRIMRNLLSRMEDENTGAITPSFLNEQIPASRRAEAITAGEVLADSLPTMFPYAEGTQPITNDPAELLLNNTWLASLEITGIAGAPEPASAGNVLRPLTTTKLALRLPPTTDADAAGRELTRLLTESPPHGCQVSFELDSPNPGWHAPLTHPHLTRAVNDASQAFFGAPAISMGCGGSIPFMEFLHRRVPDAQFLVTGVLGPHSNAHGPNEFLHIPTATHLTACIAKVMHDWSERT